MKTRAFIFLLIFFAIVIIAPAYNTFTHGFMLTASYEDFRNYYFNFDKLERFINFRLYPLNISLVPRKATIGKDGWLFLTEQNDVLEKHRGFGPVPVEHMRQSIQFIEYWNTKLDELGVSGFYVTVPPNKHTVYSEFLPNWANTGKPSLADLYFPSTDSEVVLDMRGQLLEAKTASSRRIYYKTDTHWNYIGASYGYISIREFLQDKHPAIKWLSDKDIVIVDSKRRNGGDLSAFLKINKLIFDEEPQLSITLRNRHVTKETWYYSGKIEHEGMNRKVSSPLEPLHVFSPSALNKLRVIWLRDSFGNHLSPFMAATFSDVIQQHYTGAFKDPEKFIHLVQEFEPELVIVTAIERMIPFDFYPPE
jgi:hypothetical protein